MSESKRGGPREGAGRKPKSPESKRWPTSANLPTRTLSLLDELGRIGLEPRSRSDTIIFAIELLEQAVFAAHWQNHQEGWDAFTRAARTLTETYLGEGNSNRKPKIP